LTTWVGRILPACAFTGVPFVDRRIELHSGIATDPSALSDFSQQRTRVLFLARLAVGHSARPPFAVFQRCFHELVASPRAPGFVLIHDRAVRIAVVAAVIALLDQCPCFLFLFLFFVYYLFDVYFLIFCCVYILLLWC